MKVFNKRGFVLINFILLLQALAFVILGITIQTSFYARSTLLSRSVTILGAVTLLLGITLFCICLLALTGIGWKEYHLLFAYIGSLITLICVEVALVISGCTLKPRILNMVKDSLLFAESRFQSDALSTLTWSSLQARLECCGVHNSTEWFQYLGKLFVPDSCCIHYSIGCGAIAFRSGNVYSQDCSSAIYQWIGDRQRVMVVLISIFIVIKILALCLARDYLRGLCGYNSVAESSGNYSKKDTGK